MGKRRQRGPQAAKQEEGKGEATRTQAEPEGSTNSMAETQAGAQGANGHDSAGQHEQSPQNATQDKAGNVSALTADGASQADAACLARARVRERLMQRDDWDQISRLAKEMRSECNRARMTPEAREEFVWSELDRLYPPLPQTTSTDVAIGQIALLPSANPAKQAASSQVADSGRVQGLGDLPLGWPELPANASLAAEIGWVQANRLYVVEEQANGGTRVRLDQAHEPAPSRAAIGWLETSIRSYAKYVEVAAKATSTAQDEQMQVRAERMAMEEIRALLAEMCNV